jgi:hypothetical protein
MSAGERSVVFTCSQLDYLDEISQAFGMYDHMYDQSHHIPEVWIHGRTVTFDISKPWETVEDDFYLQVVSSGESKVDVACATAFAGLSVEDEMTADREYRVGKYKSIPISFRLDGE